MECISNNPFRILGVYSNSSTKERLANLNRMKAFLKVGKTVSFPLDLPTYLSPVDRTDITVEEATSKLTLPKDLMRYAQFWFVKVTPMDDEAFDCLVNGEIDKAVEIWKKTESASSLQNQIVCALIQGNYAYAISCVSVLYGNKLYVDDIVAAVIGNEGGYETVQLAYSFLDTVAAEMGVSKLLPLVANELWKSHLQEMAVKPLVNRIQESIDVAKESKGNGAKARLDAGNKLRQDTQEQLKKLGELLSISSLQYQMIVDKLGLEILQCGIDYYNESEDPDAALKAMDLQSYASSIVVGQMASDRCKENVRILQQAVDNMPPAEVFAEDKAIREELRKFCQLSDKICHAITLLKNTEPYLAAIKRKLGKSNKYYLKISTRVVENALHNVIEEVNEAQKYDPGAGEEFALNSQLSLLMSINLYEEKMRMNASIKYNHVKKVLQEAWKAIKLMDRFSKERNFRKTRYSPNRETLVRMCNKCEIPTYSDFNLNGVWTWGIFILVVTLAVICGGTLGGIGGAFFTGLIGLLLCLCMWCYISN